MNFLGLLALLPFTLCVEFYYMPKKGQSQCFGLYMSLETLIIGEIASSQIGKVAISVMNPKKSNIFEKVYSLLILVI